VDSTSAVYLLCAGVAWAAGLYKLGELRAAPRDRTRWALCAALLCLAADLTLAAPASIVQINRVSGIPNLAAPIVYSLIVGLAVSVQVLLMCWRDSSERAWPRGRRWFQVYGVVIVSLFVLFALGDTPDERLIDFDTYYARTPYIAEFIVIYLVLSGTASARIVWMCWRWAPVAGRPWLRRGLRAITVGAVLGLAFSVLKLIAVVARWFGVDLDVLSSRAAPAAACVGTVSFVGGFMLPAFGQRLTQARRRIDRYRAYRALRPLWDALRRASPDIVPSVRLPWWDLELRLTRRLTEIADGRLALRAHFDPGVAPAAYEVGREAHRSGADLHAFVEAVRLRAAVAAKADGVEFPADHDEGGRHQPLGGTDGLGELTWFAAVSRAFVDSTVVATARQRTVRSGPGSALAANETPRT